MPSAELPLLTFAAAADFERWLNRCGKSAPGAWLRFAKQGAPEITVSKSDAIDCALAYGWVDGQFGMPAATPSRGAATVFVSKSRRRQRACG